MSDTKPWDSGPIKVEHIVGPCGGTYFAEEHFTIPDHWPKAMENSILYAVAPEMADALAWVLEIDHSGSCLGNRLKRHIFSLLCRIGYPGYKGDQT